MTQQQMVLDSEVEVKKVTRQLEVPFTNVDYSDMGKEFEEITKAAVLAKAELTKQQDAMKDLQKRAERGFKTEDVTCEMRLMYANRLVQVFNGEEMIEERAMEDSEFQQDFRQLAGDEYQNENGVEALTPEEASQDLRDVIRDEQSATKAVAT